LAGKLAGENAVFPDWPEDDECQQPLENRINENECDDSNNQIHQRENNTAETWVQDVSFDVGGNDASGLALDQIDQSLWCVKPAYRDE